mgnify:CR=1 FL=1
MATSEERRVRIPYRLGTDNYCVYEEDGGEVCMGDTVAVCSDTYNGDVEHSGKLIYVTYEWHGYIDSVILETDLDSETIECSCDGVFYRIEDGNGND